MNVKNDELDFKVISIMIILAVLLLLNERTYLFLIQESGDNHLKFGLLSMIVALSPILISIIERIWF